MRSGRVKGEAVQQHKHSARCYFNQVGERSERAQTGVLLLSLLNLELILSYSTLFTTEVNIFIENQKRKNCPLEQNKSIQLLISRRAL